MSGPEGNRGPFGKSNNGEKSSLRLISVTAYAENEKVCLPVCVFFRPYVEHWPLGLEDLPQETCCIEGFDRTLE